MSTLTILNPQELLNAEVKKLSKVYIGPLKVEIDSYLDEIFSIQYFGACFACDFCRDTCCMEGCHVEPEKYAQIEAHRPKIKQFLGLGAEPWFDEGVTELPEITDQPFRTTNVINGQCVFHNPSGKGCGIHSYAQSEGIDYHDLKPMHCALFPLLAWDGILQPSLHDERYATMPCLGDGISLYRGVRDELLYYFGEALVHELDEKEKSFWDNRKSASVAA